MKIIRLNQHKINFLTEQNTTTKKNVLLIFKQLKTNRSILGVNGTTANFADLLKNVAAQCEKITQP